MLSQGRLTPFCITPPDRVLPHTKRQRSHPRTPPAATLSRRLIQLQQQYPNEAVLTTGNTVEVDDSDTNLSPLSSDVLTVGSFPLSGTPLSAYFKLLWHYSELCLWPFQHLRSTCSIFSDDCIPLYCSFNEQVWPKQALNCVAFQHLWPKHAWNCLFNLSSQGHSFRLRLSASLSSALHSEYKPISRRRLTILWSSLVLFMCVFTRVPLALYFTTSPATYLWVSRCGS